MKLLLLAALALNLGVALPMPHPTVSAQADSARVTIIVLDQSGSMVLDAPDAAPPTQASDPQGLRCSAVRLLADLATARDALGLIRLETKSASVDDLDAQTVVSPPMVMGTAQARARFRELVRCDDARHNTPIADALQRAFTELEQVAQARASEPFIGQVLLLTDGAPAPQSQRQRESIDQLTPQFKQRGWAISTIGLRLLANGKPGAASLLQAIAARTGGRDFGDVDDPNTLQQVFLDFFAQQTGRSLAPGSRQQLIPTDEITLNVPDYATRIDVLVAKESPDATISLHQPGPSYTSISDSLAGVTLVSQDDPFYAAFSIERPLRGEWSVHSDRDVSVTVSVLIESEIAVRLDDAQRVRAANEPLILEAQFFARDPAGQMQPAAIQDADVLARVTIREQVEELRLRDDGQAPDSVAGDSHYTGALPPSTAELTEPLAASVTITARTGEAVYDHRATLQLVPVPAVALATEAIRIAPDQPIEARVELRLGQVTVPLEGWQIIARQHVGAALEQRPTRQEGDRLVVSLVPLAEGQREYRIELDLIGADQHSGLQRLRQPLRLTVDLVPTLRLALDDAELWPTGRPITITAALLQGFGRPASLAEPLTLQVERAGAVVSSLHGVAGAEPGIFVYTLRPERAGAYALKLLPPPGVAAEAVARTIRVASVPEVRWAMQAEAQGTLAAHVQSWELVDGGIYQLVGLRRSAQLTLAGEVLRDGLPYTGTLAAALVATSGTTLLQAQASAGLIALSGPMPGGVYRLVASAPGLFPPQLACCETSQPFMIVASAPPSGAIWAARGQLLGWTVGLLLLLLVGRYHWLKAWGLVLLSGDRLGYRVDGRERALDLRAAQGWRHFLFPQQTRLSKELIRRRIYQGRRAPPTIQDLAVRQARRTVIELNGQPLAAATEQGGATRVLKDSAIVRYLPSKLRLGGRRGERGARGTKAQGRARTPRAVRSRRSSKVGPFGWLSGLFGRERVGKARRSAVGSAKQRRA